MQQVNHCMILWELLILSLMPVKVAFMNLFIMQIAAMVDSTEVVIGDGCDNTATFEKIFV